VAVMEHPGAQGRPLRPIPWVRPVALHLEHDSAIPDASDSDWTESTGQGIGPARQERLQDQPESRGRDSGDPGQSEGHPQTPGREVGGCPYLAHPHRLEYPNSHTGGRRFGRVRHAAFVLFVY